MKKIYFLFILATLNSYSQTLLSEDFDNIATLETSGWETVNSSEPLGQFSWFQGITTFFTAYNGAPTSYIGVNFESTTDIGTLSNWLISPVVNLKNGDIISFYSRDHHDDFADRLELRISQNGAATNLPTTSSSSLGDFTRLVLTINPNLLATGYPTTWTLYSYTVSELSAPTNCRIAFRYFVTNGGANGANSDYIGIDAVRVQAAPLSTGEWQKEVVTVEPNPATNSVTINNLKNEMTVDFFDLTGKAIPTAKISQNSFDVSSFPTGIYFVKIKDSVDNTQKTLKLIKS